MNLVGGNLPVIVSPLRNHFGDYRYAFSVSIDFFNHVVQVCSVSCLARISHNLCCRLPSRLVPSLAEKQKRQYWTIPGQQLDRVKAEIEYLLNSMISLCYEMNYKSSLYEPVI